MLQVSDLTKSYGTQVLFDRISFTMSPGERLGLVGRNGHGKTTLFRLILDEAHPDSGRISAPSGYRIGHLSQYIRFTEDRVITEACLALPANEDHIDETWKAEAILTGLGFSAEDFKRNPAELSGGYQVRLNLAKVLVSEPNLLLLDEPTNYLDIVSIRWLIRFLRSWRGELIMITHDRQFMDSVTTHTMMIHRKKIRKVAGPTQKLYDQVLQDEEVYEKTRLNDEKKRKEAEQFISRFRAQATKARAVQSRIRALDKKERSQKLDDIKTLDFQFRAAPFEAKWLATVEDLSFSYDRKAAPLIEGLSFAVAKGDRIAVVGKNGKGKTTLVNLLAGELSAANGEVKRHPNLKLAYFGQTNIDRLTPRKTVVEELMDTDPDLGQTAARSIAGVMMFEGDNALKKVSVLSGGERSRVLLGKLLVQPANLLLLDEPTNHLDMDSVDSLVEAVDAFPGAAVIVTHSEMILNALATRLIVFDNGVVSLFEGTYNEFLEQVGWKDEEGLEGRRSKGNGAAKKADKSVNRKDTRRAKAGIIAERAKILGPLQKRVVELERAITELEREDARNTEALVAASSSGDAEQIMRLSKSVGDGKSRIEALFEELARTSGELESKEREFELRQKEQAGALS